MSFVRPQGQQRWGTMAKAAAVLVLLLVLLLDAYALYRVHVQRLGNALDYYPFWAGGREVALRQHNPYDPAFRRSVQEAIYGRPALPDENQHGYAYPAYAPFVVLPFLLLPFPASASLWIASQQFLVIAAVVLTVRAIGWRVGRWHMVLLCLAAMAFRYTMIGLVLGQTSVWVLFCLATALWAAQRRHSVLAGLALAAGSIKPQLVLLPAIALIVSLSPRVGKRVLVALVGAMAGLFFCAWIFAGPWIGDYWQQLQAYQSYSATEFPVKALVDNVLPRPAGVVVNGIVVGGSLGLFAILLWHWRGGEAAALSMALAIVVTELVVPQTGSYNLVLLLLPAVVLLQYLSSDLRGANRLALVGRALVWAGLLVVPWLLWPVVQPEKWIAVDQVVVSFLLLVAFVSQPRPRP